MCLLAAGATALALSPAATGAGQQGFVYYVGKGDEGNTRVKVGLRIRTSDMKIKDTYIDFHKIDCQGSGTSSGLVGVSNDGKVAEDGRFVSKTRDSDVVYVDGRIRGEDIHGRARVQIEENPGAGTPACNSGKVPWRGTEVSERRYENQIFG